MIRANLATRPFYNERAVQLWLLVVALVVAAATLFNVARVIRYSQTDTELASQASRDEARAADLRTEAARLRGSVDLQQIEVASTEARQANALIDRRTFSWTDLLNQFETTFPDNVRIAAVKPAVDDKGGLVLTVNVVARPAGDSAASTSAVRTVFGAYRSMLRPSRATVITRGTGRTSSTARARPPRSRFTIIIGRG